MRVAIGTIDPTEGLASVTLPAVSTGIVRRWDAAGGRGARSAQNWFDMAPH
jgi:hypothetical protein